LIDVRFDYFGGKRSEAINRVLLSLAGDNATHKSFKCRRWSFGREF